MKNTALRTAFELGQKATSWWCPPERVTSDFIETVGASLYEAQGALEEKDFGSYHLLLNSVAASELGYDGVAQEEELLAYLDDLVRGYR